MSTDQEKRDLSQKLHRKSERMYQREQTSLCFVVLGLIFVVIGVLFIFLAQKRSNNVIVGLDTGSIAYWIFLISLSVGGVSTLAGGFSFLVNHFSRKKILRQIDSLK